MECIHWFIFEVLQPGAKETEWRPLALYNSLNGDWSQVGVVPVSQGASDRTRGDGLMLYQGKFSLDRMNKFFPRRVVYDWSRPVVESPSLEPWRCGSEGDGLVVIWQCWVNGLTASSPTFMIP